MNGNAIIQVPYCSDLGILALQEFISVDEAVLYHLLLAANYLNIKSLL